MYDGVCKDDVQDALNKEEPSAIKDAYMIVRENQMMIRDYTLLLPSPILGSL